jgi:hypothetical protein
MNNEYRISNEKQKTKDKRLRDKRLRDKEMKKTKAENEALISTGKLPVPPNQNYIQLIITQENLWGKNCMQKFIIIY